MFNTASDVAKITALILFLIIIGLIVYDVFVYTIYGSDATISRVLYYAAARNPIISWILGFAIGLLSGHLFWAQKITEVEKSIRTLISGQ